VEIGEKGKGKIKYRRERGDEVEGGTWPTKKVWRGVPYTRPYVLRGHFAAGKGKGRE